MNNLIVPPRTQEAHPSVNVTEYTEYTEGWKGVVRAILRFNDDGWQFHKAEDIDTQTHLFAVKFFKINNQINQDRRPQSNRSYGLMSVIEEKN
tara:strand:+ start:101 stop:379 length:279 start_codon:yes stop_codon:yes gene_type:complete